MCWVAGEDVDTQRKGLVYIMWFDQSYKVVESNKFDEFAKMQVGLSDIMSVRLTAVHCCVPMTTVHRFCIAMIRLRLEYPNRLKMKVHCGTYKTLNICMSCFWFELRDRRGKQYGIKLDLFCCVHCAVSSSWTHRVFQGKRKNSFLTYSPTGSQRTTYPYRFPGRSRPDT